MALDGTSTGLTATIAEWLDDATLSASIPDFIALAESRLNRLISTFGQEARADAVLNGEYLPLPIDINGIRSICLLGSPNVVLGQMPPEDMREMYGSASSGKPVAYAITAGLLQFAPVPNSAYPIEIVYLRDIPPLATNTTNWLLTDHPDCYLYGALMSAEMRGWNDSRLPMLKAAFDSTIKEINDNGEQLKWGAAPLFPRIKRFA